MADSLIDTMSDSIPKHLRTVHYPPPPITINDQYLLAILQELQNQSVKLVASMLLVSHEIANLTDQVEETNKQLKALADKPSVRIDAQLIDQLATKSKSEEASTQTKPTAKKR